jgi:Holliday junction resolvase RusA-like endonuclease
MFQVTINGQPATQARPRVTRRGVYYTKRLKDAMRQTEQELQIAMQLQNSECIKTACRVSIVACFKRPKKLGRGFRILKATQPDVDNIGKFYLDCLNRVGFWTDDRLVSDLRVTKWYCADYEKPSVTISVEVL